MTRKRPTIEQRGSDAITSTKRYLVPPSIIQIPPPTPTRTQTHTKHDTAKETSIHLFHELHVTLITHFYKQTFYDFQFQRGPCQFFKGGIEKDDKSIYYMILCVFIIVQVNRGYIFDNFKLLGRKKATPVGRLFTKQSLVYFFFAYPPFS